jgi:hypothetical protein
VHDVNDVPYPALAEHEHMNRDRRKASPVDRLEQPTACATADGLRAFRARFWGPDFQTVHGRDDLWIEIRRLTDEGLPGEVVDDDRGASIQTWFDTEDEVWMVTWIPGFAQVESGKFQMLVASAAQDAKVRELEINWPPSVERCEVKP